MASQVECSKNTDAKHRLLSQPASSEFVVLAHARGNVHGDFWVCKCENHANSTLENKHEFKQSALRNAICASNDPCQMETKGEHAKRNGKACAATDDPIIGVVEVHDVCTNVCQIVWGFVVEYSSNSATHWFARLRRAPPNQLCMHLSPTPRRSSLRG